MTLDHSGTADSGQKFCSTSENVVLIIVIDVRADSYQAIQTTTVDKLVDKIFVFLWGNATERQINTQNSRLNEQFHRFQSEFYMSQLIATKSAVFTAMPPVPGQLSLPSLQGR